MINMKDKLVGENISLKKNGADVYQIKHAVPTKDHKMSSLTLQKKHIPRSAKLEFSSRYKMLAIMFTIIVLLIGQPALTTGFRWQARLA